MRSGSGPEAEQIGPNQMIPYKMGALEGWCGRQKVCIYKEFWEDSILSSILKMLMRSIYLFHVML